MSESINEQVARRVMRWEIHSRNTIHWVIKGCGQHTSYSPQAEVGKFKPDTNPADAFRVLEKCAEKIQDDCEVVICKTSKGWAVCSDHGEGMGETLPAAICAFALKLFPE